MNLESPSSPIPELSPPGIVHDGVPADGVRIDSTRSHPDVRSFRRKLGLLVPVTNTSMEHELWTLLAQSRVEGVGIHTTTVVTPRPVLRTEEDLREYGRQFVAGLGVAVEHALLAAPDHLVMGMSLEHIFHGIEPIRALTRDVEHRAGLRWTTWQDAADAALRTVGARRIGLLTPFDRIGNANARRMFEDLGYEVVTTVGFACAHARHIAHVPDDAKETAITELICTRANRVDAVVQCGTNMSFSQVSERLEPRLGIPLLGINAVVLWHALRQNGIEAHLEGGGRLLREA